jgi:hypothetical protein
MDRLARELRKAESIPNMRQLSVEVDGVEQPMGEAWMPREGAIELLNHACEALMTPAPPTVKVSYRE